MYKSPLTLAILNLQIGDNGVLLPLEMQKRVGRTAHTLGIKCATKREINGLMVRVWRIA